MCTEKLYYIYDGKSFKKIRVSVNNLKGLTCYEWRKKIHAAMVVLIQPAPIHAEVLSACKCTQTLREQIQKKLSFRTLHILLSNAAYEEFNHFLREVRTDQQKRKFLEDRSLLKEGDLEVFLS